MAMVTSGNPLLLLSLTLLSLVASTARAFVPLPQQPTTKTSSRTTTTTITTTTSSSRIPKVTQLSETKDDLIELAYKLNPKLGYYDPLNIVDTFGIYGKEEAWIGWLRQSEIKHGRVAMMGFVGYIVQCFYTFPYACKFDGTPFPSAQYSPPQQWDELPTIAKLHFFIFIGFLEWYNELSSTTTTTTTTTTDRDTKNANVDNVDDDLWSEWKPTGQLHYTKGGQPGKYPEFVNKIPHYVPFNLYDPFNLHTKLTPQEKQRKLRSELNNGRLAMFGIMGFLSEQSIPGSVPFLTNVVPCDYNGNIFAPFETDFTGTTVPTVVELWDIIGGN